jgi:hypothetical protein
MIEEQFATWTAKSQVVVVRREIDYSQIARKIATEPARAAA